MPVKTKMNSTNGVGSPEYTDTSVEQRTVVVDGYSYTYGPNETKNFGSDGVGVAAGAFAPGANITQDIIPFGTSRS